MKRQASSSQPQTTKPTLTKNKKMYVYRANDLAELTDNNLRDKYAFGKQADKAAELKRALKRLMSR